jgi:hypothetical protein
VCGGHRSRNERLHETRVARRCIAGASADASVGRDECRRQTETGKPSRDVGGCRIVTRRACPTPFEGVACEVSHIAHHGRGIGSGDRRRPGRRLVTRGRDECHQSQRRKSGRYMTQRSDHDSSDLLEAGGKSASGSRGKVGRWYHPSAVSERPSHASLSWRPHIFRGRPQDACQ